MENKFIQSNKEKKLEVIVNHKIVSIKIKKPYICKCCGNYLMGTKDMISVMEQIRKALVA